MSSHNFDNVLRTLVQASGSNTGKLRTDADRASFQVNTKSDFAALFHQHNALIYPLLVALRSGPEMDDALALGLEGRTVTTFGAATSSAATCYWDPTNERPRSIKETIDCLIAELARIENIFSLEASIGEYDDGALVSAIACLNLNDAQLSKDILGPNYTLDCDGNNDLPYSLARHIHEFMTQLVNGYPGAGLTFTGEAAYPSLSLTVLLSQVTIDTTLPPTVINSTSGGPNTLVDDLSAIRTFIGMDDAADSTPDYSAHGAISTVSDGDSLELAIQKLDQALTGSNSDENVKVTANDTTAGYLFDKITTTTAAVTLTEVNDGADEDLRINVTKLVGDSGAGGVAGLAPAPAAGDAAANKYLHADGSWTAPAAGADLNVSVSANDTTPGLLVDKMRSATTAVTYAEFNDGGDEELEITVADMVGDSGAGGTAGLVPAPGAGDAAAGKYLDSDGTWTVPPDTQPALLVDSITVYPKDMQTHGADPQLDKIAKGATADVITATQAMIYPAGEDSYCSFPVPVPRDTSGNNPTSFVAWAASFQHTTGTNTGVVWEIEYALSGGVAHLTEDGEAFAIDGGTGWGGTEKSTYTTSTTNINIHEFASQNIEGTTKTGHLHVKVGRLGSSDVNDDFTGVEGLLYLVVEWTW